MDFYYRAVRTEKPCKEVCGKLKPRKTTVEATTEKGHIKLHKFLNEPIPSREVVLPFSKSSGGAVIGAVTGEKEFSGGRFCICKTKEEPDVEIKSNYGDFPIIEEVRYREPVQTKEVGDIVVGDELEEDIETAYVEPMLSFDEWKATVPKEKLSDEYMERAYEKYKRDYQAGDLPRPMNPEKLEKIKEDITSSLWSVVK